MQQKAGLSFPLAWTKTSEIRTSDLNWKPPFDIRASSKQICQPLFRKKRSANQNKDLIRVVLKMSGV